MEIKHYSRITWKDLPWIESPFFARSKLGRNFHSSGPSLFRWPGDMSDTLLLPHSSRARFEYLLNRIDNGTYVLLLDAPMQPALRWMIRRQPTGKTGAGRQNADKTDAEKSPSGNVPEGYWAPAYDMPMLVRWQIETCLGHLRRDKALNCDLPESAWWNCLLEGSPVIVRPYMDVEPEAVSGTDAKGDEPRAPKLAAPAVRKVVEKDKIEVLKVALLTINFDKTIPVVRDKAPIGTPSWEKGKEAEIVEENEAKKYYFSTGSKRPGVYRIKGKQNAQCEITIKIVESKNMSGNFKLHGKLDGLMFESKEFVSLAEGTEQSLPVQILNQPDNLQHYEGDASWEVKESGGASRTYSVDEKTRLEVFFIYDTPAPFYNGRVWVEPLRVMFKKAQVKGMKEQDDISGEVTKYLHSKHGMRYDTNAGQSHHNVSREGGSFKLMGYILKTVSTANCYDQAAAVQAFCGCLGVNVQWVYLRPFGYIKTTNLLGVGNCNNPFYDTSSAPVVALDDDNRTAFGNHAFIETISGYIRDACAGPHFGKETLREYLESSIEGERSRILFNSLGMTRASSEKEYFDELVHKGKDKDARKIGVWGVE